MVVNPAQGPPQKNNLATLRPVRLTVSGASLEGGVYVIRVVGMECNPENEQKQPLLKMVVMTASEKPQNSNLATFRPVQLLTIKRQGLGALLMTGKVEVIIPCR
jgi:hypothetical protein